MSVLTPPSLPGLPIYTLRLGALNGSRPAQSEVAVLVGSHAQSFSLTPCDGFFGGVFDPGWSIMVAHEEHEKIAGLAEALRQRFAQEGIGIEAYGRYLRCRAGHGPAALAAEFWGLRYGFHPAYSQTRFCIESHPAEWPEDFAIITACATTGEVWTADRNREADEQLRRSLLDRGVWHHRITGASPDGQHAEPGWAASFGPDEAKELGSVFSQDAIYFVGGDALSVLSCVENRYAPLGSFRDRLKNEIKA
jgi:hypothetical protein